MIGGQILTLDAVTLDNVTVSGSVSDASTLTIDDTVTLSGATINGGTIDDTGTLLVSASSEIENATVNGGGDITVIGGQILTLDAVTLDNVTVSGSVSNASTLTIDDTVTLSGATINHGTIDDTGKLLVSASSEIENATVNGGGDITVIGGQILTLDAVTLDNVTVSGSVSNASTLTIDDTVTLSGATINHGTIDDTGKLLVSVSSEIENATVNGGGDITVIGGQILTLDAVTLDNVTVSGSVSDASTLTIDDTVTLSGATINGQGHTIDDTGTLLVSASSEIENATINGGGDITVISGILTLDAVTLDNVTVSGSVSDASTLTIDDTVTLNGATINGQGHTIDDTGTLLVSASSEIENATINGGGDITVTSGILTLDNMTLDGVTLSGNITIDPTVTLDDGTTITAGGTLTIGTHDTLDVERGSGSGGHGAILDGVNVTDHGGITVGATSWGAILTLDDGTTIGGGGTLTIDAGSSLQIETSGATLDGINVTNHGIIQVDVSNSSAMLMLDDDSAISGDSLSIGKAGLLDVETGVDGSGHGATLDGVTVNDGGSIEVGENSTDAILTLEGGTTISGCGAMTINAGSTLDVVNGTTTIDRQRYHYKCRCTRGELRWDINRWA